MCCRINASARGLPSASQEFCARCQIYTISCLQHLVRTKPINAACTRHPEVDQPGGCTYDSHQGSTWHARRSDSACTAHVEAVCLHHVCMHVYTSCIRHIGMPMHTCQPQTKQRQLALVSAALVRHLAVPACLQTEQVPSSLHRTGKLPAQTVAMATASFCSHMASERLLERHMTHICAQRHPLLLED